MSAVADYANCYTIDGMLRSLAGSREYMSWAPQSYWDSQEPGVAEYESWQLPQGDASK